MPYVLFYDSYLVRILAKTILMLMKINFKKYKQYLQMVKIKFFYLSLLKQ